MLGNSTTFVSMCFNMGMQGLSACKGHVRKSYKQYYVDSLLEVGKEFFPLILFCDAECAKYVREDSGAKNIRIVEMELADLEKYTQLERYVATLSFMKAYADNANRKTVLIKENAAIEDVSKYTALNQSKIDLMKAAAVLDGYSSQYYFWIDAGMKNNEAPWKGWSGKYSNLSTDKFKCCLHINNLRYRKIQKLKFDDIMFVWSDVQMPATVFAINSAFVDIFHSEYNMTIDKLFEKNRTSSEQGIITWMIKEKPHLFDLVQSFHYDGIIEHVANTAPVCFRKKSWVASLLHDILHV